MTETPISLLSQHTWALAAVSAAAEGDLVAALDAPRSVRELADATGMDEGVTAALLDVLAALELVAVRDGRYAPSAALTAPGLAAELRSVRLQSADLVDRARHGRLLAPGWDHRDPELLQAQGDLSAAGGGGRLTAALARLDGIPEAMASGRARLLDVGAGVAAMPIAACREVPGLLAVALEPHPPSADLAERKIAAAGLSDRIELRRQRVEELRDLAHYDVVHLPIVFLPDEVAFEALRRVRAALRPGGWLLTGTLAADGPG